MNFIKKWLFRSLLLIIAVLAILAGSYNSEEVSLTYLGYTSIELPITVWLMIAFLSGTGFGILLNTVKNARLSLDVRKARKETLKTTKELDQLRAAEHDTTAV